MWNLSLERDRGAMLIQLSKVLIYMPSKSSMQQVTINQTDMKQSRYRNKGTHYSNVEEEELKIRLKLTWPDKISFCGWTFLLDLYMNTLKER